VPNTDEFSERDAKHQLMGGWERARGANRWNPAHESREEGARPNFVQRSGTLM